MASIPYQRNNLFIAFFIGFKPIMARIKSRITKNLYKKKYYEFIYIVFINKVLGRIIKRKKF